MFRRHLCVPYAALEPRVKRCGQQERRSLHAHAHAIRPGHTTKATSVLALRARGAGRARPAGEAPPAQSWGGEAGTAWAAPRPTTATRSPSRLCQPHGSASASPAP